MGEIEGSAGHATLGRQADTGMNPSGHVSRRRLREAPLPRSGHGFGLLLAHPIHAARCLQVGKPIPWGVH